MVRGTFLNQKCQTFGFKCFLYSSVSRFFFFDDVIDYQSVCILLILLAVPGISSSAYLGSGVGSAMASDGAVQVLILTSMNMGIIAIDLPSEIDAQLHMNEKWIFQFTFCDCNY